jgi:Second Messenger Oligonucleotide or Dinucleotide Synthetase domain
MTIGQRFQIVLDHLGLTWAQRLDGYVKIAGVTSCLNKHCYGISSPSANSVWVGSWGKSTEIRPPRDIDLLFILPDVVYYRYQRVSWNRQSRLLQDVKSVLEKTYSRTQLRGDGQVVVVPFDSYAIELVLAFPLKDGRFLICNTHSGGSYKIIDPVTEIQSIEQSDVATSGNTRDLIRLIKRWQEYCNVPLKSFWIELLCKEFLGTWPHSGKGYIWYDWMVRDFFAHLINRPFALLFAPGTGELVFFGEAWRSKAMTAYRRAARACNYDYRGLSGRAAEEWQGVFGPDFPTAW